MDVYTMIEILTHKQTQTQTQKQKHTQANTQA